MDKKRQHKCVVCAKYYSTNFRRFPTDPDLIQKWLEALRLDSFKPCHIVCYSHFDDTKDFQYSKTNPNFKRLKPEAVPSIPPPVVSYALCNETFFSFLFRNLKKFQIFCILKCDLMKQNCNLNFWFLNIFDNFCLCDGTLFSSLENNVLWEHNCPSLDVHSRFSFIWVF